MRTWLHEIKHWLRKEHKPSIVLTDFRTKKEAAFLGIISIGVLIFASWKFFSASVLDKPIWSFGIGALFILAVFLLALGFAGKVVRVEEEEK